MLKKIISGGQTGADRAALDVAIKFNIPHGGWIPKGRIAEDGPLPDKYQLQEMATDSYPKRTEQNVIDSDGTLIISHGKLTGGSVYTRKMAKKHKKPYLHIDLRDIPDYHSVFLVRKWMYENEVEIINVGGPRASKDPLIYDAVFRIIRGVYWTDKIKGQNQGSEESDDDPGKPETVDAAVKFLITEMSLKDKSAIAKMSEDDLSDLHFSLGLYIRNRLLYPRNERLLESCRAVAMDKYLHWDQASGVIIKKLWEKLQETHKLRVIE